MKTQPSFICKGKMNCNANIVTNFCCNHTSQSQTNHNHRDELSIWIACTLGHCVASGIEAVRSQICMPRINDWFSVLLLQLPVCTFVMPEKRLLQLISTAALYLALLCQPAQQISFLFAGTMTCCIAKMQFVCLFQLFSVGITE